MNLGKRKRYRKGSFEAWLDELLDAYYKANVLLAVGVDPEGLRPQHLTLAYIVCPPGYTASRKLQVLPGYCSTEMIWSKFSAIVYGSDTRPCPYWENVKAVTDNYGLHNLFQVKNTRKFVLYDGVRIGWYG